MLMRIAVVKIIDGEEVVVGLRHVGMSEFLSTVIVSTKEDLERITKIAEAWERLEYRRTSVEYTEAEQEDMRQIIAMRPGNMRVIEHEPQRAISQQKSVSQQGVPISSRPGRWHE